jgi:hypothetical protein
MATNRESTITILYGSGATGAPTDLFDGEMAYANVSGKLFVGGSGNNSANWVGARILDEDDFASNSDQHLATQQSIKAYVTNAVSSSTSGVSSVNGATGAVVLDAANGLTQSKSGNTITYRGITASTSQIGVASFSSDNFSVVDGVVTVKDGGIANAELVNSSITINTLPVSLGGSVSITSDYIPEGLTNKYYLDSRARGSLSATGAGVGGGAISYNSSTGVFTLGITGTANQVAIANNGSGLITVSLPDDVVINNSLTVNGTVTTVNTTQLNVADPLIFLATGNASNSVDIGFFGKYIDTTNPEYTGLFRDATDGKYRLFDSLEAEPTTTVNTAGTGYGVATLVAKISAGTYS